MRDSYLVICEDGDVENTFPTEEAAVEAAKRYIKEDTDLRERTVARVIKRFRAAIQVEIVEET